MGTKSNPGNIDCYTSALPDEPIFVLLGRDPALPATVRFWREERARLGKDESPEDLEKLEEADFVANAGFRWRRSIVENCDNAGIPYPWKLPRPPRSLGEDRPVRVDPTIPGSRALDAASFLLDALEHPLVRKTLKELLSPSVSLLPLSEFPGLHTDDPARGADTSHATVAAMPESQLAHDFLDDGPDEPKPGSKLTYGVVDLPAEFEGKPDPSFPEFSISVPANTARRMIENSGEDQVDVLVGDDVSYQDLQALNPKGYRFVRVDGGVAIFAKLRTDDTGLGLGRGTNA